MTFKPRAVIVDIDGTLSNLDHRKHIIDHDSYDKNTPEQWEEFNEKAALDTPVQVIVELVRTLHTAGYAIVLCTSRNDPMYALTAAWLKEWGIPYDALYMRPQGDKRPDTLVKLDLLTEIRKAYEPFMVLDDRPKVVEMWREAGLVCLQCAPGEF